MNNEATRYKIRDVNNSAEDLDQAESHKVKAQLMGEKLEYGNCLRINYTPWNRKPFVRRVEKRGFIWRVDGKQKCCFTCLHTGVYLSIILVHLRQTIGTQAGPLDA